jgi:hypothetical protein
MGDVIRRGGEREKGEGEKGTRLRDQKSEIWGVYICLGIVCAPITKFRSDDVAPYARNQATSQNVLPPSFLPFPPLFITSLLFYYHSNCTPFLLFIALPYICSYY